MMWVAVNLRSDRLKSNVRDGTARATQVYYVESDLYASNDQALSASANSEAIPAIGAAYSDSRPFCVVDNFDVDRITFKQFKITVEFFDPTLGQFSTPEDLLSSPPEFEYSIERSMEEYTRDESDDKKAVVNSAGEPFDKGPERFMGHVIMTIGRYVTQATRDQVRPLIMTTNSSPITIDGIVYPKNTALLGDARFSQVKGAPGIYRATLSVVRNAKGWSDQTLNMGFSEITDDGGTKPIKEDDGINLIAKPWPLDEYGEAMPFHNDDPTTLTFQPYAMSDWTQRVNLS